MVQKTARSNQVFCKGNLGRGQCLLIACEAIHGDDIFLIIAQKQNALMSTIDQMLCEFVSCLDVIGIHIAGAFLAHRMPDIHNGNVQMRSRDVFGCQNNQTAHIATV